MSWPPSTLPKVSLYRGHGAALQSAGDPGTRCDGGFDFELEDYGYGPLRDLGNASTELIGAANRDPNLSRVFTTFRSTGPEIDADVDRAAADLIVETLGERLKNLVVRRPARPQTAGPSG